MGISLGSARADQAAEFLTTMGASFGFDLPSEDRLQKFTDLFEWERSIVARDDGDMVGTTGAFSLELTVPGATMRCGGTTVVSVLPSHRRQGILRRMMKAHLDEVRQRDEPIAALWASDSAIYGRFGFGCATQGVDVTVSREHAQLHRLSPPPAPVRLVTAQRASHILPELYEQVRSDVPGFLRRTPEWWNWRHFRDGEDDRDGATSFRYAVTGAPDEITGFVQYRQKEKWTDGHGQGEIQVNQLLGSDPESWVGLWKFVLEHDLIARVTAPHRSVEDPLLHVLAGGRRARLETSDALWVRVMDARAALEGRSYSDRARVVIGLADPGTTEQSVWHLDLSREGATVTPTDASPTVTMDLEDMGACFLGWSRFGAMARSGRVKGAAEDVAALDRAFAWSPLPWCPEVF